MPTLPPPPSDDDRPDRTPRSRDDGLAGGLWGPARHHGTHPHRPRDPFTVPPALVVNRPALDQPPAGYGETKPTITDDEAFTVLTFALAFATIAALLGGSLIGAFLDVLLITVPTAFGIALLRYRVSMAAQSVLSVSGAIYVLCVVLAAG